jgi:hypothetical protein
MYFYYFTCIADWTYSRLDLYNVGNIETCELYLYDSGGSLFPNNFIFYLFEFKNVAVLIPFTLMLHITSDHDR